MYKRDFDRHMQNATIANAVMLFGESHFYINRYTDKLLSLHSNAMKLVLYYDEYDFNTAYLHLSQGSLFSNSNILVIKTEKKIPKAQLDKLVLAAKNSGVNYFIYAYFGNDYKTSDKAFSQKSGGMSVRFFHPNYQESVQIMEEEANTLNLQIDKYCINHLLHLHNHDVPLCLQELQKLAVYDTKVDIAMIDKLVFGLSHVQIDKLLQSILSKEDITQQMSVFLQSKEDEIAVVTALGSYITQLYLFNTYIRINGSPDAKAILGYNVPAFVLQNKASFSLKFKPKQYFLMLKLVLDTQLKMKLGGIDKSALLFSMLIRLQKMV